MIRHTVKQYIHFFLRLSIDGQRRKNLNRKFCKIIYITIIYLQYKKVFFEQKLDNKIKNNLQLI